METMIQVSKDFCGMEAIRYVASRYNTTPEEVLIHYFIQTGMVNIDSRERSDYELEPNELALFRDLGVGPKRVEIK